MSKSEFVCYRVSDGIKARAPTGAKRKKAKKGKRAKKGKKGKRRPMTAAEKKAFVERMKRARARKR